MPIGCSGSGAEIAFGRPVVPDEYRKSPPSRSSSSGVAGRSAISASYSSSTDTTRTSPAAARASPSVAALANTIIAPESCRMYATSSAVSRDDTAV